MTVADNGQSQTQNKINNAINLYMVKMQHITVAKTGRDDGKIQEDVLIITVCRKSGGHGGRQTDNAGEKMVKVVKGWGQWDSGVNGR